MSPHAAVRQFDGPAGTLEALFEHPDDPPRAVVVFGHPHPQHGGTMHTKVVHRAAKTYLAIGCAVLRFNFRGVGTSAGHWDEGRGERDDFLAALDFAAATYPGVDIWSAGFSFGAWLALTSGVLDPRVTQVLGIAPPTERYDFSHVTTSDKPKHFIHGERDELVPIAALQAFFDRIREPKTLTVINSANHLFDGRVEEVGAAIRNRFTGNGTDEAPE
ncbi:MAG: alpha/beta hydrolase [Acidobacteriota bacterium]|nr:alpha/beta hydrolase [Acidobacteriota bacterium]